MRLAILATMAALAVTASAAQITDATFWQIMEIADREGVPRSVAAQLMTEESGGDILAIGDEMTGWPSVGLFQLHTRPANINYLIGRYWRGPWEFDIFDPIENATLALRYLADLHDRFGSWYMAACRYNCGPGAKVVPERTRAYARRIVNAMEPLHGAH